jgi:hypothetical protein
VANEAWPHTTGAARVCENGRSSSKWDTAATFIDDVETMDRDRAFRRARPELSRGFHMRVLLVQPKVMGCGVSFFA